MKRKLIFLLLIILACNVFSYTNRSRYNSDRHTGAPGERSCGRCHVGASGGEAYITGTEFGYIPGELNSYTLHLSHPSATMDIWGFQMIAKDESNRNIGEFVPFDSYTFVSGGGYLNMTWAGCYSGDTGEVSWTFYWRAPTDYTGEVTFYASCTPCDNDDSDWGDVTIDISHRIEMTSAISEDKITDIETDYSNVSLYNLSGTIVATGSLNDVRNNLPTGLYFAKPQNSNDIKKIMVVR